MRFSVLMCVGVMAAGCNPTLEQSARQLEALAEINSEGSREESNEGYSLLLAHFRAADAGCAGADSLVGAKAAQAIAQYRMNGYPVPGEHVIDVERYLTSCGQSSQEELASAAMMGLGMLDRPHLVWEVFEKQGRGEQFVAEAAMGLGFACDAAALKYLAQMKKAGVGTDGSSAVRNAIGSFERSRARCNPRKAG